MYEEGGGEREREGGGREREGGSGRERIAAGRGLRQFIETWHFTVCSYFSGGA